MEENHLGTPLAWTEMDIRRVVSGQPSWVTHRAAFFCIRTLLTRGCTASVCRGPRAWQACSETQWVGGHVPGNVWVRFHPSERGNSRESWRAA